MSTRPCFQIAEGEQIDLVHRLLLSLTIAFAAAAAILLASHSRLTIVLFQLDYYINVFLHLDSHHIVGVDVTFLILALTLGMSIFVFLQISSRTSISTFFLCNGAGVAAVLAPFVCWYVVIRGYPSWFVLGVTLEAGTFGTLALLYSRRRLFNQPWALVFTAHFGYWSWMFSHDIRNLFLLIVPICALLSCLTWMVYVGQRRGAIG